MAVVLLLTALPGVARAATFQVTTTADVAPGNCDAAGCSLREAVNAANSNGPGDDVIELRAGTYSLTRGQLLARGGLTIAGAGSRATTIDPSATPGESRTLDVIGAGITVNLGALAITGGDLQQSDGGAVLVETDSTLNLFYVAINRNEAFNGAGVHATGTLNAIGSIFNANHALGADQGDGAAILLRGPGAKGTIANSTFVGNHGPDLGGAIGYSPTTPATLALVNVTLSDNHADHSGGGIAVGGAGTVQLLNTIVARNTVNRGGKGANCDGRVASRGHNLEGTAQSNSLQTVGGDTCGLRASGDLINTEPRLGRTRDNGGTTDTRELLRDSPAIDAGAGAGCPNIDQRGVGRPQGGGCDIGAFELATSGGSGAPKLSRVRATKRMRRGRGFFSYRLSENARVSITLHRGTKGKRVGGKCVKRTRSNRRRRGCVRYKRAGRLSKSGKQGPNRNRFSGKIRRKRLRAGSYRATFVAKNANGVASKPVQVKFKIVRR